MFKDIAKVSSENLADTKFYEEFYKRFLSKYRSWDELDPKWIESKLITARLLKSRFSGNKDAKILSSSCGVGFIEKELINSGLSNLDITETSELPLRWIKQLIPQSRIFIGFFPDCIPGDRLYDFIYLSGAEYFLNQQELTVLLNNAKSRLLRNGKIILVSFCFEPSSIVDRMNIFLKDLVKYLLGCLNINECGQFWGYSRSKKEFNAIMNEAGYTDIQDGLICHNKRNTIYWIEGNN